MRIVKPYDKQLEIHDTIKDEIVNNIEHPYGRPTDIIGFDKVGKKVADAISPIIGEKEICFFDEKIKSDNIYHYLDFASMLEKTEIMIFTKELPKKCYKFLDKLNPKVKKYPVHYYDKDGDAYYWHTEADYDSKVPKLDYIPSKANHTFIGYYADEAYTTPFNFEDTVIKGETTVYIKFEMSNP